MLPILRKLTQGYIWKRIFYERLTEPLHLNLLSLVVWVFGSYRAKIAFDLVFRHQHAFGILKAAERAKGLGLSKVTLIEFGVAAGAGIMNMAKIAARITKLTGVEFQILGFDTGKGMPPPIDYRDHPELYQQGDFPMDFERLSKALPANCQLVIGPVGTTAKEWAAKLTPDAPIGFVSLDVDYYSSSVDALKILTGPAEHYLPVTTVYLDDLEDECHNSYCGELLAVHDFNTSMPMRKIERHDFFRCTRVFKNAKWIDHMFFLHVLDHPIRTTLKQRTNVVTLTNTYLPSSN